MRTRLSLAAFTLGLALAACGDGASEGEAMMSPPPMPTPMDVEPVTTSLEDGGTCDDGVDRSSESFITVSSPEPNTALSDQIELAGCGNVFEATYQYRVTSAEGDGTVYAEGFDTMTCGTGCVGEFATTITGLPHMHTEVVLTVFESSARDGSEVNVVTIPLMVVPSGDPATSAQ